MFCCNKVTCFLMHNVSVRCSSFCIKVLVVLSSVLQSQYLLSFPKEVAAFYTNSSGCYVAVM